MKDPIRETRLVRASRCSPGSGLRDLPRLMKPTDKPWCRVARGMSRCCAMATQRAPGLSHLERKLVHGVDPAEVAHDEVEQRGPGGGRPVVLPGLVDSHLGHLGLQHLLEKSRAVHCSNQPGLPENHYGRSVSAPCVCGWAGWMRMRGTREGRKLL